MVLDFPCKTPSTRSFLQLFKFSLLVIAPPACFLYFRDVDAQKAWAEFVSAVSCPRCPAEGSVSHRSLAPPPNLQKNPIRIKSPQTDVDISTALERNIQEKEERRKRLHDLESKLR